MISLDVTIPRSLAPLVIRGEGLELRGELPPPDCRPEPPPPACWVHRGREERPMRLAGHAGSVIDDSFGAAGLELVRQVWVADRCDAVAVRARMANGGPPVELDALVPLRCVGPDSLLLSGATAGEWEVVAQARYKNGVPTALRPGTFDEDYAQAVSRTGEQGDAPAGVDGRSVQFEMDPYGVLRRLDDEGGPCLLLGHLSQTGHLARFVVRTDAQRSALDALSAECEFDGCLVPRGGERTSQWVLVRADADPHALVADYTDRVGAYHHVPLPRRDAPSVLCSWYYYGPHFAEADLHEDLAYLEGDRIPLGVFLIDECWDMHWGDWLGNERWPSGMRHAAERISALGYRPGIWTCPYLAKVNSRLAAERPNWLLRLRNGTLHVFEMDGPNYVLDPTYPGVCDWIEALYRRLREDWGYTYHKLDFLRAVFVDRRVRFHDPTVTRLEAYCRGLEAVRRGIGPDAYLSVCGGHYGGSLGLADSQRSGSDVTAVWDNPPALPKLKQNIHRTWMSRLWYVDPDAMMVRRREEPINDTRHGRLSLGKWTDAEARTIAVNQYIGGGMVTFTERFAELDADRKALYRHVIPSINSPAVPVDYFAPRCPTQMRTWVQPASSDLRPWVTVAVCNWADVPARRVLGLSESVLDGLQGDRFLAYEFFRQQLLGVFARGGVVDLGELAPHGSAVVKVVSWDGRTPTFLATDLHFSMGGVEIASCSVSDGAVRGRIETRWPYPVRLTAAFPTQDGPAVGTTVVPVGEKAFHIEVPATGASG